MNYKTQQSQTSRSGTRVAIGASRDRPQPEHVTLEGRGYFLTGTAEEPRVFSDVCPHMGGKVGVEGDELMCPLHGWRFSGKTGLCSTSPGQSLRELPCEVADSQIWITPVAPPRHTKQRRNHHDLSSSDVELEVLAHACLSIRTSTPEPFELLTDPWLSGPAFLGSWIQYPHIPVDPSKLAPQAVWISHEHSDHFHEPTLRQMSRRLPIYVPDFPNQRLQERLRQLGFTEVTALPFGVPKQLREDVTITVYEPESLWNDAILLVEIDGLRILNLNDAGLNNRIAEKIGPVDIVCSAFTPGASGYPLTWTHLDDAAKAEILGKSRQAMIEMLRRAVSLYGAQALLPFAGHFALLNEEHEEYLSHFQKNSLADVKAAFEEDPTVHVLDLLPGESWKSTTQSYQRFWSDPESLGNKGNALEHVRQQRQQYQLEELRTPLTISEVRTYLATLGETLEVHSCENLAVSLHWCRGEEVGSLLFEIVDRTLGFPQIGDVQPDLTISLPERVLAAIVRDGASWDEAHIGYWCTMRRDPDVYHAGFWRLLQAPRTLRGLLVGSPQESAETTLDTPPSAATPALRNHSVRGLIENLGPAAVRLLHRSGLYCLACEHAEADTLGDAARCHGLTDAEVEQLERDLGVLWKFKSEPALSR